MAMFGWRSPFASQQGNQQQSQGQQQGNQQQTNVTPQGVENSNMGMNPQGMQGGNMTQPGGNQQGNQQQSNQQQNNQGGQGRDPMHDWGKLWDNGSNEQNQQNQNQQQSQNQQSPGKKGYVPQIDPKVLQDTISKFDVVGQVMTPELRTAIVGGGEQAVAAMGQLINGAIQQSMKVMWNASNNMMTKSFEAAEAGFLQQVPDHVRDFMSFNNLASSNPLMKNPNYAPLVDSVRQQIQMKYPKATADQIQAATTKYFDDMYADMNGTRQQQQQQNQQQTNDQKLRQGSADADWAAWIEPEVGADGGLGRSVFGNANELQIPNQGTNPNQQDNNQLFNFG